MARKRKGPGGGNPAKPKVQDPCPGRDGAGQGRPRPPAAVYLTRGEAEVADRVRQQQARNRLASIREIAAARNARLGLHDDPSDDAEDDGEIVQRLGVLRIIESDED